MAFDPSFTSEEFKAEFEKDPKIVERLAPVLTAGGYAFRDKAANDIYESGLKDKITRDFETLNNTSTEKEIFDLTGEKRDPAKETVSQYRNRVIKDLKTGNETTSQELTRLKGTTDLNATERARMAELEKSIGTLNTNHATEKKDWEKKLIMAEAKSTIAIDLSDLRAGYLKTIPKTVTKMAEDAAIVEIMKNASMEQGKLVFLNADGSIERDGATMLPITAMQKLQGALKDILDPGHKVAGGGGGNREPGNNDTVLPEGVTTQPQLMDHLIKVKKMVQDSPEIIKEFIRLGGDKLPLWD